MKLNSEAVHRLVQVRAEISKLTTEEADLTDKIKIKMKKKKLTEFGPSDCPFKLVKNEYERSSVSWVTQWKRLAKKLKMDWKKEEKRLKNKYKSDVESLIIEPNEAFTKGGK